MTLDEARANIGRPVVYHPAHGGPAENGVITAVGQRHVLVRYNGEHNSKATIPALLELADTPAA